MCYVDSPLNLKEFIRYVRPQVAKKWYDLGINLSLNTCELDNIEANNSKDVERCCTEMYKCWLRSDCQASQEKLAVALQHTGFHTLAKKVQNNN